MNLKKETIEIDNLVRNINKILNCYTKAQLSDCNLTLARFYSLWVISKLEPVNMSQLKENIMVSNSTLTVTIDHLAEEGFVDRYRDRNDRRVVLLKITTKGKKQLQDLLKKRQKFFQESLKNLNQQQQNQIIKLLEIVLMNLEINYSNFNTGRE